MTSPRDPVPRPGIAAIRGFTPDHAKDPPPGSIRLWANESSLGPSPHAVAAYHAAAAHMLRYPDGSAGAIRAALAAEYNLDAARILMGVGSDELLSAAVRAYAGPGDEVLTPTATFPMYRTYAQSVGAAPVQAPDRDFATDVDALLGNVTAATKVVIVANPNNPSGTYARRAEIERLRAGLRDDILLIIDAAYAEYCERDDYEAGAALADATRNTAMTRTFSKIHGLAGLRLGWLYAAADIVGVVGRIRSSFNVPAPAQAAGVAALADRAHRDAVIAHCRRWRAALAQRLGGLGLAVSGSEGNFVTFGFAGGSAQASAAEAFLRDRGLLLRPMAAFGMPGYLRVTIGRDDEMAAFLAAMEAMMDSPAFKR